MQHLPEDFRKVLLEQLTDWKSRSPAPTDPESAKRMVREGTEYMIRMVWLGRRDKMSRELWDALDAVSKEVLPESYAYTGAMLMEVMLKGHDHNELARMVFDQLWDAYMADPDPTVEKPPIQRKKNVMEAVVDFFRR